jgi:hypothetical protein
MCSCWSLSALVAWAVEAHRRASALSGLRLGPHILFGYTSQARRSSVSLLGPLDVSNRCVMEYVCIDQDMWFCISWPEAVKFLDFSPKKRDMVMDEKRTGNKMIPLVLCERRIESPHRLHRNASFRSFRKEEAPRSPFYYTHWGCFYK